MRRYATFYDLPGRAWAGLAYFCARGCFARRSRSLCGGGAVRGVARAGVGGLAHGVSRPSVPVSAPFSPRARRCGNPSFLPSFFVRRSPPARCTACVYVSLQAGFARPPRRRGRSARSAAAGMAAAGGRANAGGLRRWAIDVSPALGSRQWGGCTFLRARFYSGRVRCGSYATIISHAPLWLPVGGLPMLPHARRRWLRGRPIFPPCSRRWRSVVYPGRPARFLHSVFSGGSLSLVRFEPVAPRTFFPFAPRVVLTA